MVGRSNVLVAISIVNGAHVVCIGSWYAITMLDALLNDQHNISLEAQKGESANTHPPPPLGVVAERGCTPPARGSPTTISA
jgi:hypothetical protein